MVYFSRRQCSNPDDCAETPSPTVEKVLQLVVLVELRVIGVFAGDGAPSGPNYLLFSDVDRPSDSHGGGSDSG